ncbi:hypothetical protein Tco_0655951 [Tanacetum coccineum]|uniref:Uncharacterized protein n=1 Tax=Tanacetum coccineum TaxID=301880 RepID=A0ABQ4X8M5_9ASTR
MLASMLSLSDLIFSGGGDTDGGSDDEGSAVANSAMRASADGDGGVWGRTDIHVVRGLVLENKMIWCGEVGGVEADSSVSNASVSSA